MAPSRDESDSDEDMIIIGCLQSIINRNPKKKRKKRVWVRDWIARRSQLGAYGSVMQELLVEDPSAYKQFVRMTHSNFCELLELVDPLIRRQDTVMRQSIKPAERLALTLRYLASGNSFADLMFLFRIPDNTVSGIVMDTCTALYSVLKDKVLKTPSTKEEWRRVAREFEVRWNLPNCIGALDGKHVEIHSPGTGSTHFNYLKFHSIILFAVVDAKYRFLFFDVGTNGRAGDAAIFRDSSLVAAIESNSVGMPEPVPLPGRNEPVSHFFVGDDAFPLRTYLMKPYPFRTVINDLTDADEEKERRKRRIYGYRISRARRISQHVFGILASRFRVFRKAMPFSPEKAVTVTLACIALHNWLMSKSDRMFCPPNSP